ncbi:MAG: divergent polysaccharide deacetylase family protein [Candidatus Omnitrophica bacterium]|nr:divergent polysaccharide deacetylase family protein [Candidatus Omnitrophota bacterium]
MAKRKVGGMKKFFEDYPIIPIVVITFALGALAGYGIAQKSFRGWSRSTQKALKSEIFKKVAIANTAPDANFSTPTSQPVTPQPYGEEKETPLQRLFQPRPVVEKPHKPKIVFVIDDLGYNKRYADLLFSINRPLTVSILPQLPYSKYFAEEAKKRGFETLLHLPLEPESTGEDPGPGLIKVDMKAREVQTILENDLASVPGVVGVNNHMGSSATRDRGLMYLILKELNRKQLFFLDSMTHSKSAGHRVAYALGMPVLKRDIFLDNIDDYNYVMEHIQDVAQTAMQAGSAIAIGHIRENTLSAIKKAIPRLEEEGFEISTLRDLR